MAVTTGYSASNFALEIEGQFVGWLSSVEGGVAYGVVLEKTSANGATDKSISEVKYADIVVTCGAPQATLANWLTEFLKGKAVAHGGAVAMLDHNQKPLQRLEWDQGVIVGLTLPALDASGQGGIAQLTLTIRPDVTRLTTGPGAPIANAGKQLSPWRSANFAVTIPGVRCTHVNDVEPLTISQTFIAPSGRGAPKPGPLQVGDLVLSMAESGGTDFRTWSEDFLIRGNNSNASEKSATIRYLAPNLKTEIFSVNLQSVGIHRLDPKKRIANLQKISRLTASMYCEQADLVFPAPETAPPAAAVPAEDGPNNLREFLGVRLGAEEVTRRLRDTKNQPPITSEADRQRQLGVDLGIAWAERRASLAELEEFGTVDDDWSSIELPDGHSLAEVLEATGVVPTPYDGRLELSRDSLVEGLLAGILKVMSEVSEEITQNLK